MNHNSNLLGATAIDLHTTQNRCHAKRKLLNHSPNLAKREVGLGNNEVCRPRDFNLGREFNDSWTTCVYMNSSS